MSQPVVVLDRPDTREHVEHGTKTFTLELEILGEPVSLDLKVADSPARLSDLAPLARTISAKLALATSERLRTNGRCVTCRKGCSACCSYLVPLSVPEAFRIAEELPMMPAGENGTMIQSSLDACRTILDRVPGNLDTQEPAETNHTVRSKQLGHWYAGLGLACPFLSNGLCVPYEQRPIACREHMVTGPADSCDVANSNEPDVVKMPVSVLECLGQLTAELEQSEVEAVMLPLALPWAHENIDRSRRTWPAVTVVERFVRILHDRAQTSASNSQP